MGNLYFTLKGKTLNGEEIAALSVDDLRAAFNETVENSRKYPSPEGPYFLPAIALREALACKNKNKSY